MANHYSVIHQYCKPTDIVVLLDGDDAFAHNNVLSLINEMYVQHDIWLTYGQYRVGLALGSSFFCRAYDQRTIDFNFFRYSHIVPSHLKTFYAALFHKIKVKDLMFQGQFFEMAGDMAIMFPMIEMARKHFMFIDEPLVKYNRSNPIGDHQVDMKLQQKLNFVVRSRTCYNEIASLFD